MTKMTFCVAGLLAFAGFGLTACGGDDPAATTVPEPTATDRPLTEQTTPGEQTVADAPDEGGDKKQGKQKDGSGKKPKDEGGDKKPAPAPAPSPAPDGPQLDPTETDPDADQVANGPTIPVAVYENPRPDQPRFSWGPAGNDQKYVIDSFYNSIVRDDPGPVKIKFVNRTGNPHSFEISGPGIGVGSTGTDVIRNGKAPVKLELRRGDYYFHCSVLGHETKGMYGHLQVG